MDGRPASHKASTYIGTVQRIHTFIPHMGFKSIITVFKQAKTVCFLYHLATVVSIKLLFIIYEVLL